MALTLRPKTITKAFKVCEDELEEIEAFLQKYYMSRTWWVHKHPDGTISMTIVDMQFGEPKPCEIKHGHYAVLNSEGISVESYHKLDWLKQHYEVIS